MCYSYKHPLSNWMQFLQKPGFYLGKKCLPDRLGDCVLVLQYKTTIQSCSDVDYESMTSGYQAQIHVKKKKTTLKAHSIIQMFLNIQMFGITKAKHLDSNEMFQDILLPISLYKHLKDSIKFFLIIPSIVKVMKVRNILNVNCSLLLKSAQCCWL